MGLAYILGRLGANNHTVIQIIGGHVPIGEARQETYDFAVGHVFISGWRQGQSGKSVQYVKLGSAERRLSRFMGEGAKSPRIPD